MALARQTGWDLDALLDLEGDELMAWFGTLRDQIKRENEALAPRP